MVYCTCHLLLAGFWLGLQLDLEDGYNVFLQNVGGHLPNYTASQPRRLYSSELTLI
jgi:hypothetical protein